MSGFLRLSSHDRRRIYNYLGLFPKTYLYLGRNVIGQWSSTNQALNTQDQFGSQYVWTVVPRIPNQLFYVSRKISEDSRAAFYGNNAIAYQYTGYILEPDLYRLRDLTPLAWRSLKSLSIAFGYRCYPHYSYRCHGTKEDMEMIDTQLTQDSRPLREWRKLCDLLATSIKHDDKLTFELICDAARKESAAVFLDPLHKLPRFKDLSIRLGAHWNVDLQQMIMETIRQRTRCQAYQRPPKQPFRFFKLPDELQVMILESTGLVSKEPWIFDIFRDQFVHRSCYYYTCTGRNNFNNASKPGYFCPSTHTAFTTILPCWRTPCMLFLVSRQIRTLTFEIFFKKNTFEIQCEPDLAPPISDQGIRKSVFLRRFPQDAHKYLRRIHWIFPIALHGLGQGHFRAGSNEVLHWITALHYIAEAVDPGVLTLEIDLWGTDIEGGRVDTPQNRALYNRVVQPLARLESKLKNLLIHIFCPRGSGWVRRHREQQLERKVMGPEYDSFARGKEDRLWHPVFLRY